MMTEEQVEALIEQAHGIFGKTSIYEVIDIEDQQTAISTLVEFYGPVDMDEVDRYLAILDQIREDEEGGVQGRKGF